MTTDPAQRPLSWPPPPQAPRVIREWDRRAIEVIGIPGVVLMENAGREAARSLIERARRNRDSYSPPWWIACGPGNNGGDGFVVARYLDAAGEDVRVLLAFDPEATRHDTDSAVFYRVARAAGLTFFEKARAEAEIASIVGADRGVVVDALLGTGSRLPLRPPISDWVESLSRSSRPVVALDLPTGLDADSGEAPGPAIRAQLTLTFAAAKLGFFRGAGPRLVGELEVLDIGLPRSLWIPRTPI
jgi:hydroxyethylthiazole kinase-like uncharacterized protein yjeF